MLFQVLQADGGNYCAAVNAATLALIDAGIPLKDYVTACTAGYINDRVLVDVNNTESRELLILRQDWLNANFVKNGEFKKT